MLASSACWPTRTLLVNRVYSMSGYIDDSYGVGTYHVDYTVTDSAGNTAEQTATYTVTQ